MPTPLCQFGECGGDEGVEASDGRDVHAFVGRMGKLDLRAERDHVDTRNFLAEKAAFQAGMNRLDLRIGTEFALVDRLHDLQ